MTQWVLRISDSQRKKAMVFHLEDGVDQLERRAFGARRSPASRGEQPSVLSLHEGVVEAHERGGFEYDRRPQHSRRANQEREQAGDEAVGAPEIWRPLARPVEDH
jgi:hypothetical protein